MLSINICVTGSWIPTMHLPSHDPSWDLEIMDLGIWTSGSPDLEIGDPGSQNLDPSIDRPQGSIDRPQGIMTHFGPISGPKWTIPRRPPIQQLSCSHCGYPGNEGQKRYHSGPPKGPQNGLFPTYPFDRGFVSFSLSRARAKVYIGDPGTGAQDPRSERSWV